MGSYVILFPSSSYAIFAKRILIGKGYRLDLIPVPREFSSSCGVCIKIFIDKIDNALELLRRYGIDYESTEKYT